MDMCDSTHHDDEISVPLSKKMNLKKLLNPCETDPENSSQFGYHCFYFISQSFTCPDVSLAVSELAHYLSDPHEPHWYELKGILRYPKITREFVLFYRKDDI